MSDNSIPTPAATTPTPMTVVTKTPKGKGLSIYNRVTLVLLLVPAIATTTLFIFAVQKTKIQKNMQDEIQILIEQKDALTAPARYTQMTPDNTNEVDELYSTCDGIFSAAQETVKKECKDRVDTAQLLKFNDAENAFMADSTHELDDAQTALHCFVDISPANDAMKTGLEAFQIVDLTLKIWFGELQFVLGTPDHVVDDVVTAVITRGEKMSVDFTLPFDTSWNSHYKIEVAKYLPSM